MKVLVTGGAGFLGSHVVDRLLLRGDQVLVLDHLKAKRERFVPKGVQVIQMAVEDPQVIDAIVQEAPDVVVHLAAQISVTQSVEDPAFDARVNVIGALHVLQGAVKARVKRLVFASSGGAIYGDHPARPTAEERDVLPLSPYGIAKQTFEHYLESAALHCGISTISLRFSNIYGPRQQAVGGYAGVLPAFLSRLKTGERATIFGDGTSTRDYVFVGDAADAILLAIDSKETGIVNISSGKETAVRTLWDKLLTLHGKPHEVEHAPGRPGEVLRSHLDPSQAKKRLRWRAKTSLREGLAQTYDWFMGRKGE